MVVNTVQLNVQGDLSRFMNNTVYAGSVNFSLRGQHSYSEQRNYLCSAVVLAQRSGVLENLICGGTKEIPFAKELISLEEQRGLADCIKICYGGCVKFTFDNVTTIIKFASLYQIEGMLEAAFKWVKENTNPKSVVTWYHLGILLETEFQDSSLVTFFKEFISKNAAAVVDLLLDCVQGEKKDLSHVLLEVTRSTAMKSVVLMGVLEQWLKQSLLNRQFILNNAKTISFQTICPDQAVFLKFIETLQQGDQSIATVEIIKEIKQKYNIRNLKGKNAKSGGKIDNPGSSSGKQETTAIQLTKSGSNSNNKGNKGKAQNQPKTNVPKRKFKLYYALNQLRDGKITLDSILEGFRVNAVETHGYNEYEFIETCLEWMTYSEDDDGDFPSDCDMIQLCSKFKIFSVNYTYISSVWDHMDTQNEVVLNALPTESRWSKRGDRNLSYKFSRDDISSLKKGWVLTLEIPADSGTGMCKQLGCNLETAGPHVVIIQLKEKPPLFVDQDKVDKSKIQLKKYHTHPGFVEHCYGLTTTASGKNEIISLVANNREEFVDAMNERKSRQICIVCAV